MRPRCRLSIKETAAQLGIGHRKLHARLVKAGALERDSRLACWRVSKQWSTSGLLQERECRFYNQSTGLYQWGVKILVADPALLALELNRTDTQPES